MFSEIPCGGFYFIGIGGVSMSALALLLRDKGFPVCGSDKEESKITQRLKRQGISVYIGEDQEIEEDNVVFTGAISQNHPQLARARKAGKRVISRSELLKEVAEGYPRALFVAGCHGKTTTTCMLAHIFHCAKKKATSHIGGEDLDFLNYRNEGEEYFISEACEFQRGFLNLRGDVAVILNTDLDHTDCYHSQEELLTAYNKFASRNHFVVVNAENAKDRAIRHALCFGNGGDVYAEDVVSNDEKYSFTIVDSGAEVSRVNLCVAGRVNVNNALAAYCAAKLFSISADEVKRGLEQFRGVKRRFERVGTVLGVPLICDYAHHPKEMEEALITACRICKGTVRLVFQPHTYTRTRDLMGEFVEVLKQAENPIIYKTYSARESFLAVGSAYALVSKIPEAIYVQTPGQLFKRLKYLVKKDDLVLVLGAGDIYEIAKSMIDKNNPPVF